LGTVGSGDIGSSGCDFDEGEAGYLTEVGIGTFAGVESVDFDCVGIDTFAVVGTGYLVEVGIDDCNEAVSEDFVGVGTGNFAGVDTG
jgi:hypothetical protein